MSGKQDRHTSVARAIFLFILFTLCAPLCAQKLSDSLKKYNQLVLPVVFKTPEMGFAGGLSGSFTFKTTHAKDTSIRTSLIQGIGFVTTRRQNVEALDASIFFPKENYIFLAQLAHSYFPDKFWGLGTHTVDRPYESYIYEQVYGGLHLKRKIHKNLFAGALYEYQNVFQLSYKEGGLFDNSFSSNKKTPYQVSGLGLSASYDTRNSAFWPSKGVYLLTQFTDFRKVLFSDFNLFKWITDVRYFKKIAHGQIMALQFYSYETKGSVPLRELAPLGGPNNMRGFYQGRFRAKSMLSLIGEYRLHIKGRFSTCFFGGIGDVYNHATELKFNTIKYSYGGGLRFAVLEKEKLNIRIDYGYSNRYNQGLYITFGECF